MSRLISFFTESGKVLISPDELFYLKSQSRDYNGILSAIFYSAFLGLIIGLLTGEPLVIVFLIIGAIIVTLLFKVIQAIFIYIFSRILPDVCVVSAKSIADCPHRVTLITSDVPFR